MRFSRKSVAGLTIFFSAVLALNTSLLRAAPAKQEPQNTVVPSLKDLYHSTWLLKAQRPLSGLPLNAGPNAKISFEEMSINGVLVPAVVNADQMSFAFDSAKGFAQRLGSFVLRKATVTTKQTIDGVGDVDFESAISDVFECRLMTRGKVRRLVCKVRQSDKPATEYEIRSYSEISYEPLLKGRLIP